ncbi:MAG: hypothetical protein V7L11_06470 [Nostoc sp.]|uniref:hypothetical protein n=1 Tax=Nostoc sp. TaxID=1180 RepID=UPI002FF635B9
MGKKKQKFFVETAIHRVFVETAIHRVSCLNSTSPSTANPNLGILNPVGVRMERW